MIRNIIIIISFLFFMGGFLNLFFDIELPTRFGTFKNMKDNESSDMIYIGLFLIMMLLIFDILKEYEKKKK